MALAGERTSGDRRKAASPATGGPPLSLRLLEPPCLRSPTAQAAGRPWASRPLPSEPCSVSTPLAHCPGVGVCLGQAPPLLLSPSRHRGGRPLLIHPSLQLCVRKHSGPSRGWPCRQGSGAPVPCPPPSAIPAAGRVLAAHGWAQRACSEVRRRPKATGSVNGRRRWNMSPPPARSPAESTLQFSREQMATSDHDKGTP